MSFIDEFFEELAARRKRLRSRVGDRGQSLVELAVLAGLVMGSLGLYIRPWMPNAAPWGFAIPFVFVIGYVILEARRQAELKSGRNEDILAKRYDWAVMAWSFGCAAAGLTAFVFALLAEPAPPPAEDVWRPPEDAVMFDLPATAP